MQGRTYAEFVTPYIQDAPRVTITPSEQAELASWSKTMAEAKKDDVARRNDRDGDVTRQITGIMGELAVQKLLGRKFIDWSITVGGSAKYHKPDLDPIGLKVGVKTVEWKQGRVADKIALESEPRVVRWVEQDRFHLISPRSKWAEIFTFRQGSDIVVCGVATVPVLREFLDDDLIESPNVDPRRKTGFWGFHKLKSFQNLSKLKDIMGVL